MADLNWHEFLEIGVDFIDDDHKQLLSLLRDIKAAVDENNRTECIRLFEILLQDIKVHFDKEEQYLASTNYPELEEHKVYHQGLLNSIIETQNIFASDKTRPDLKKCFTRVENFLTDDILRGDIKFKSFLEFKGYIKKPKDLHI